MITLPEHVKNKLAKKCQHILPENMTFKLLNTSDHNIYLWFIETEMGFLVEGNYWMERTMADASKSDINHVLPYTALPLECLHIENTRVYKDFSVSWYINNEFHTCSTENILTQLTEWHAQVLKKSKNWWLIITGRSKVYRQIAMSLSLLSLKIIDHQR